ncbi:MAG: hypothetical protein JRI23_02335 [Deltaproteobacteria bacterium]|jgi:stringent starvation protein B|nr:hypothetical protein [Deltaproteobacteria bacterium]MBW2530319.1 hypothetical protein [Deltaproteobacteria bacterium]
MSKPPTLPPKREVALALLEGPSMFVHLDPRREGVTVPQRFRKQAQLVLQLGLDMAVRIPDLEVTEEGITATLSFNRTPHWCGIPWAAVYALVGEDGRGMVWPDDVPPELAVAGPRPRLQAVEAGKAPKKERKRRPKPKASEDDSIASLEDAFDDEPDDVDEEGEVLGTPTPDGVAGEADDFGLDRGAADARPPLAVVPAPQAAESVERDVGERAVDREEPASDDDAGDDGTKRKLPPYLRIIK